MFSSSRRRHFFYYFIIFIHHLCFCSLFYHFSQFMANGKPEFRFNLLLPWRKKYIEKLLCRPPGKGFVRSAERSGWGNRDSNSSLKTVGPDPTIFCRDNTTHLSIKGTQNAPCSLCLLINWYLIRGPRRHCAYIAACTKEEDELIWTKQERKKKRKKRNKKKKKTMLEKRKGNIINAWIEKKEIKARKDLTIESDWKIIYMIKAAKQRPTHKERK